jgi:hypothetical protein
MHQLACALQVVYLVCMAGRIISAMHDSSEEQEVRAAVESVFPFSMLAQFLTLQKAEKEMQLSELPYIVLGICLFNQASGASEGKALTAALEALTVDTAALLKQCEENISLATANLLCYSGASPTTRVHSSEFAKLKQVP